MTLIQTKALTKTYNAGTDIEVQVLKGINLTIQRGEYIAIMGPSGSGKSTLMHLLGFLDTPSGGQYLFDNEDTTGFNEVELARIRNKKAGFVFQAFHLLPRTSALENVELPMLYARVSASERIERATKALESVGLGDRLRNTPAELSGGQQQRVSIARAMINTPQVLFADEPTGNLDSASSAEIMQIFDKLHRSGTTIIMVTHEDDIAAHATRKIVLKDGQIVEDIQQRLVKQEHAG